MNQELLLLRHGKSDWSVDVSDFDRPLKKRGIRGAKETGFWLLKQQLLPDLIVSSPAERAIDTTELVCQTMGVDSQSIKHEQRLYGADLQVLKQVLVEVSNKTQRILLVGHNPGLEELLIYLSGGKIMTPENGKLLPTATVARLQIPVPWKEIKKGSAKLVEIHRPDQK